MRYSDETSNRHVDHSRLSSLDRRWMCITCLLVYVTYQIVQGPNHNSYNNTLYHIDSTLALYAVIESNLESNACQGTVICINLTQVKCEKRRAYTLLFVKLELTEIIMCHSTSWFPWSSILRNAQTLVCRINHVSAHFFSCQMVATTRLRWGW